MRSSASRSGNGVGSLALFLALAVLLFIRPDLFQLVVNAIFAFVWLLIVPIVALILWVLVEPQSAARYGITVHQKPSLGFVGSAGVGTRLRVVEAPGATIRVEWSRTNYVVVLVLLAAFGPGIGFVLALRQGSHPVPLPILAVVSTLAVMASVLLAVWAVKAFRKRPALEVSRDAIVLICGPQVERRIAQRDIDGLRIEPHTYVSHDEGSTTEHANFILTARLVDGSDVRLCISDSRPQIESLIATMRTRLFLGPDRGPPGL